jgi:tripartite-type tricarboxylate transporter receptor subunit TctC
MHKFERIACAAAALVLWVAMDVAGAQATYPSRTIRLISPNPPGGGTTLLGRLIGQKLTDSWGQWILLDNRPGAHGMIGGSALLKAAPDGHTLMVMTTTHIITPLLVPAPYDPIKDFTPVSSLTRSVNIVVVHPAVPAHTIQELIALEKSKPGSLNYGTSGSGTTSHLSGELLSIVTGTKIQHVPYKGSGPAVTDLLGGQIQFMFAASAAVLPFIHDGKLRALATTGKARLPALPNVPTIAEAGYTSFSALDGWYGILAPPRTPRAIVDKWSTELARILALPDIVEKIVAQGMEPLAVSPEEFRSMMAATRDTAAKIIKTAKVKID